ncbi:hypothetical protein [Weeksella sp. HMSC059D05]|uniref:hypothetical protein n=1 Tax=Weeksella sp. HMSC059D05 TaxID=1715139 RepID=UPI0008A13C62|nr:hypothetical protein [Weeksella sp. HMSC059D05]OFM83784.1 hypothetical protein HMPREF2660_09655 [Weeksella sp. HMSC059D05]
MRIFIFSILFIGFLVGCKEAKTVAVEEPRTEIETTTQITTSSTEVALNPEHGQPNHRCDIPVGAPLDIPVQNTNTSTTPQYNPNNPFAPNSSVTVEPEGDTRINPPHGEDGHLCEYPVGARIPL